MTLDDVAEELYGLDPSVFVATRTERQKQARADGDKALAKEIGALRRPTTVGWVLNVLVRDAADEVSDLLELGEALREAQEHVWDGGRPVREGRRPAGGPVREGRRPVGGPMREGGGPVGATLRTLTKQRRRAVRALADRAGTAAADRDRPVGEDVLREVTQSLNAALSDADIADELRRGRMVGAVEYSGFGPLGGSTADLTVVEKPSETAEEPDVDRAAEEHRRRTEAEVADAESELEGATDAADRTDAHVSDARATVDDLTRRLDAARAELSTAEETHAEAVATRDAAQSRVRNARKRLDRV